MNIEIQSMHREELPQALSVLGKAFATQPSSYAIYIRAEPSLI